MPTRPLLSRVGWTLRDYAKRVWDNSGEDNVLFLAGGIAFNIILAGSLLLTPFIVNALAGAGLSQMAKDVGSIALAGWRVDPKTVARAAKPHARNAYGHMKSYMKDQFTESRAVKSEPPKSEPPKSEPPKSEPPKSEPPMEISPMTRPAPV